MHTSPSHLTTADLLSILPHRPPMLLVDEVSDLICGQRASARVYIRPDWEVFTGHFPDRPVLPGIYITECMAQAAGAMLLAAPDNRGCLPLLFEVSRMRFLHPVLPGDTLCTQAALSEAAGDMYVCTAASYVGERCVARGRLTLALKHP
ncbi:MAG: beta-hydroxyacyl-ACP dehydratase [Lachnospiraceae bacterium]|nr:beta-hydroxyacyl-ACP dehydratase [Lachnospiraceae bacterium]